MRKTLKKLDQNKLQNICGLTENKEQQYFEEQNKQKKRTKERNFVFQNVFDK